MSHAEEPLAEGTAEGLARALGIDFGEKRIGLAISDPDGRLAVPLATLTRRSDRAAAAAIAQLARSEGVRRLVLGEPLSADGVRGPAAQRVRRFGARLAAAAGLPLTYVDETLTSVEAAARLRAAGVDLRRQPERIDAAAAQILLQEDLDRAAAAPRTAATPAVAPDTVAAVGTAPGTAAMPPAAPGDGEGGAAD